MQRGGPFRSEYRVRQHDGVYRWIEANGRVDLDATGAATRFPGVLIEIEHRRAIEAELRDLNQALEDRVEAAIEQREKVEEALRQSQKMEAVGQPMCMYLPRYHGETPAGDAAAKDAAGFEGGFGETVLVIDDEPTVRVLVVDLLQDAGYRVLEAGDGITGLNILQSDIRIDLLITDVGLPGGMNGQQVADAALVLRPDLKVLFITGYAENAIIGHGHLDPGMQVITKPFAMEALATKVRDIIDS